MSCGPCRWRGPECPAAGHGGFDGPGAVLEFDGGEYGALALVVVSNDGEPARAGAGVDVEGDVWDGAFGAGAFQEPDGEDALDVVRHGAALVQ